VQWEAVTAVSAVLTALIILATAIYASRQVNVASRATQLDAMFRLLARYQEPQFLRASRIVLHDIPKRIREEPFRAEVAQKAPESDSPWHVVLRLLNETGVYVELGLIEGPPIYYLIGDTLVLLCKALEPIIEIERQVLDDPHRWTNTIELCNDAEKRVRAYYLRNPRPRPSTGEPFTIESLLSKVEARP
jgi:hypothetical protein